MFSIKLWRCRVKITIGVKVKLLRTATYPTLLIFIRSKKKDIVYYQGKFYRFLQWLNGEKDITLFLRGEIDSSRKRFALPDEYIENNITRCIRLYIFSCFDNRYADLQAWLNEAQKVAVTRLDQ